jgi:hypothetical protein
MFTYGMLSGTRAATISLREGLKTRGFATVLFEGFSGGSAAEGVNAGLVYAMLPPEMRQKYKDAMEQLTRDDTVIRARANAFCTILCYVLNNPFEAITEHSDTRYSYEEIVSWTEHPHFDNPKTGGRSVIDSGNEGSRHFKIQRYDGIVNNSLFAKVLVWPDDVERFRPALEKVLHSMVDVDPPEQSTDFRRGLVR